MCTRMRGICPNIGAPVVACSLRPVGFRGLTAVQPTIRRSVSVTLMLAALAVSVRSAEAQIRLPGPYSGPYGRYRSMAPEAELKVEVKPKEASVYVDGYFAGT